MKQEMEVIEAMTYEQWEKIHAENARYEARCRQNEWNRKHAEEQERREYFCRQKFYGGSILFVLLILNLAIKSGCLLILSVIPAMIGIELIKSDKMLIYGRYYDEHGGTDQWKDF
jgi:hypothetical protein